MKYLRVADLLDDINTDAMTPAWVCFSHRPEDIARDAYAGLIVDGKRFGVNAVASFRVSTTRMPRAFAAFTRYRPITPVDQFEI